MQSFRPSRQASSVSLRSLGLAFWLVSSLLMGCSLAAVHLLERQRSLRSDADHSRALVMAILTAAISDDQRQALIGDFARAHREEHPEGLNLLLVVDASGRIVFSSRPAWRGLLLADPLPDQLRTGDPAFRDLVRCFRRGDTACVSHLPAPRPWLPQLGSELRSLERPAADLGLSKRRYALLVREHQGSAPSAWLLQLLADLVLGLLLGGLLTLLLRVLLARQLLPRLTRLAQIDPLTQLMNRGIFMDLASHTLAAAEAEKRELVFAIVDVDHFKRINDTHGHGCGDAALRHLASVFRAVSRRDDLLCRLGGEEFALLLPLGRQQAALVLERLRLQMQMSVLQYRGHRLSLSASIGAVACADGGYNLDELYSSADQALYSAKRAGRNRLCWSEGRMLSRLAPDPHAAP
ncbi:MAG: diguanylate cyclase [Cyanobium sp.]